MLISFTLLSLVVTTKLILFVHSSKLDVKLLIISLILFNSLDVFSANTLIFPATTEKPRPASPALAASIDAFKANKFVWDQFLLLHLIY